MTNGLPAKNRASKRDAESDADRQPPLRLVVSGVPCKPLATLTDTPRTHATYALAATLWHHRAGMEHDAERALFAVLFELWPKAPGRPGNKYDNLLAAMAERFGVDSSHIAESFQLRHARSIPKKIHAGADYQAKTTYPPAAITWTIECVTGDAAAELCGPDILPAPLDPGSDQSIVSALGVRPSWEGLTPAARADSLDRFARAIAPACDPQAVAGLRENADRLRQNQ